MDDSLPQSIYSVKTCRKQRIVTQNRNGPCPALALYNALLLNGRLKRPISSGVSAQEMMDQIGNLLISIRNSSQDSEIMEASQEAAFDIFSSRQLLTGLDINVKFNTVEAFEFTPPLSLFDFLGITLYHCWVIGESEPAYDSVKNLSYNQLVVTLCEDSVLQCVKDWYNETITQATEYGLIGLSDTMKNGEIGILFRNNHYFTITKQHDRLFTLVTDQGYLNSHNIVWEELSLTGGGDFFNEDFLSNEDVIKSDEELARQLQDTELKRANQTHPQRNQPSRNQDGSNPRNPGHLTDYHQDRDQERIRRDRDKKGCDLM